jgi:hypothetical protein
MVKYIVYLGKTFTIEWYFSNKKKSYSKDYFQSLDISQKIKAMNLFQLMGEVGKILNIEKFRNVDKSKDAKCLLDEVLSNNCKPEYCNLNGWPVNKVKMPKNYTLTIDLTSPVVTITSPFGIMTTLVGHVWSTNTVKLVWVVEDILVAELVSPKDHTSQSFTNA